jgi:hypothetical protein
MSSRNRSEGWTHAKISGHSNEEILKNRIKDNSDFRRELAKKIKNTSQISAVNVGGINETNVADVFGGKTKSKTDLILSWEDGLHTNISIKKSSGGQVYLIGVDRFLAGYQKQFNEQIDAKVIRAFKLFFGGASDMISLLHDENLSKGKKIEVLDYELRKKRMTWKTMSAYDNELCEILIKWFQDNIRNIILFCFQRGLASNQNDWAEFVWYHNEIESGVIDSMHNIEIMAEELASESSIKQIEAGEKNGGTTIKLPFGFVQWHLSQIQFHHQQHVILNNSQSI